MVDYRKLYGALTNLYFRFYDLRMGESTTGTGRMILRHQCSKVNEVLGGEYDYNGDAIIYGDTDSTYFKTFASSNEEAIVIADAVADEVNKSYPPFMRDTFLCQPGFDTIIKAGREIVSDRGIFVEKKRYILHLINLDGKPVDKLKIMGLDTKKTILPKEIADKLNSFIERLLKGEDWDTIAESIVEYKENLRQTSNILEIGLPKGVHGVEDKMAEFRGDLSKPINMGVDSKTRLKNKVKSTTGTNIALPGGAAASIHYNLCLEMYEDKLSPPIISGTKIKIFYLTETYGRFKTIALPTDLEVIPEWFRAEYEPKVDVDAHIERLIDNPLTNILKAIEKEPPSKQTLLENSLFVY